MKVRSSLVLSAGDELDRVAREVQRTIARRRPELAPVVAFLNVRPDGAVVRRLDDGKSKEIAKLSGVTGGSDDVPAGGPGAHRTNYASLIGEQAELLATLRTVVADVRSQDKLVRLQREQGWEDSGGLFVYALADSFGPLASVLPLALLKVLGERHGKLGSGFELSLDVLYFLPRLFLTSESEEGRRTLARALARSHATFSEMEAAIYPRKGAQRTLPCRVWVAGSADRQGAVADFSAVCKPAAHFTARLIDGSLKDDRRWDNELAHLAGQRRTFLSSFGVANLCFPRRFLNAFALTTARRQLHRRLSGGAGADVEAVSAAVQSWIGEAGIDDVLGRLRSPEEGKLVLARAGGSARDGEQRAQLEGRARTVVLREPDRPPVAPNELVAADYAREVAVRVQADPSWGAQVRKAGDRLFDACLASFREELARRLDSPTGGLAAGRTFCAHVSGTGRGLTEALVGADVRNLDSLAFQVQCSLAGEAGMEGNAERVKKLRVLEIPGKEQALASTRTRIEAEQRQLQLLSSAEDPRAGQIRSRISAWDGDVEKYQEELAELRRECADEEGKVDEQRRMARDPTRRHLLLARLSDAEADDREEDQERLRVAAAARRRADVEHGERAAELARQWQKASLYFAAGGVLSSVLYVLLVWSGVEDLSFLQALMWLFGGAVAMVLLRVLPLWRARSQERNAWNRLLRAREAVTKRARQLWSRQIRGMRRRFAFLVHAEAIRVLDRLRDEVVAERARIETLEDRVREYGTSVDEAEAALESVAPGRGSDFRRESVLTREQAETLIRDNKKFRRAVDAAVDAVSHSAVVQDARQNESTTDSEPATDAGATADPAPTSAPAPAPDPGPALGPSAVKAEAAFQQAVGQALDGEHVATVLDRGLVADRHDSVRVLWRGVQHAARAQLALHPDGAQGVVRNLVLLPSDSSNALKAYLKENVVADGSVDWSATDRDDIGICKTVTAFATCQVAELSVVKEDLDAHWEDVCAHPGVAQLSLPSHEALAHVEDEDALVVLQAAVAYLSQEDGKRSGLLQRLKGVPETAKDLGAPNEWIAKFQAAEEIPSETVEELTEQLRVRCESRKDDAERLRRFNKEIPMRYKLTLEFLMEGR